MEKKLGVALLAIIAVAVVLIYWDNRPARVDPGIRAQELLAEFR